MQCPYCQTENRDDRERCYNCDRDLSMLRVIVHKARYHYNMALEHAERGRYDEAIAELHNAIDVDRSFVPAHVVLGTIYAKKGDFENARKAWETALSLNPELNKAHRYLGRLEQVAAALPVLRTLRLATAALAGLVIVLVVALLWVRRPDAAGEMFKRAYAAYEKGQYGEVAQQLDKAISLAEPDSPTAIAARALRDAVELDMRQKLQLAQELKNREDYPGALALIAELEAQHPDPETSGALAMLKQDINHYYRDRILALYNQFLSGEVTYPELWTKVSEFLRLYPNIPEKDELRKFLDDAREYEVTQQMDNIHKRFDEDHDTTAAIQAMQDVAAAYPGTDAMKKMRPELVGDMLKWMFDHFVTLLDQHEYDKAHQWLNYIRDLASEFRDVVDVKEPLDLAARVLDDNERIARLHQVDKLIEDGRFSDARDAIMEIMSDERLTSGELAVVMAAEERLEKKELKSQVDKLRARRGNYLAMKFSTDDATETLALVDKVLGAGGEVLDAAARVDLLACGAAAALKVKDEARAQKYLDLLAREKGTQSLVAQLRKLMPTKSPPALPQRKPTTTRSRR
jgi:tetratricopeptide (TPR) repeat protein